MVIFSSFVDELKLSEKNGWVQICNFPLKCLHTYKQERQLDILIEMFHPVLI